MTQGVLQRELKGHMEAGTKVEVLSRFDGSWSRGFEIAERLDDRTFRVRRLSDGSVLPSEFTAEEIRRERKRNMWWV
jgi:hypothetical protein